MSNEERFVRRDYARRLARQGRVTGPRVEGRGFRIRAIWRGESREYSTWATRSEIKKWRIENEPASTHKFDPPMGEIPPPPPPPPAVVPPEID